MQVTAIAYPTYLVIDPAGEREDLPDCTLIRWMDYLSDRHLSAKNCRIECPRSL
jgi:hypothetical protein